MTSPIYDASIPLFRQLLGGLSDVLTKAATHAEARKIEPTALLQMRVFPDMFPLLRQVQIATDFARSVSARLAGVEVPSVADAEQTFDDLQTRIKGTLAFLDSLTEGQFDGAAEREIVLRPGTPKQRTLSGQAYLLSYGLPQFFFHVTTAYSLLRHGGVEIGKRDFMGAY